MLVNPDQLSRTVQQGNFQLCIPFRWAPILTEYCKSLISFNYLLRTLLSSSHPFGNDRYFAFGIAVIIQCQLLRYLVYSVAVCSSMSLSLSVSILHQTPIASSAGFGNVFRPLNRIVCWYVAVPGHSLPSIIAFVYMTHNAINRMFVRFVTDLFCSRLSFPHTDTIVSFVS